MFRKYLSRRHFSRFLSTLINFKKYVSKGIGYETITLSKELMLWSYLYLLVIDVLNHILS
jgi:hypothetical protein